MLGKGVKTLMLVLVLLALLPSAQSMDIGTVVKRNELSAKPGQTVEFSILFWNLDNQSCPIRFNLKELPKGFEAIVKPGSFVLEPSGKEGAEEYISLPQGVFEASPVKVYVKVPSSAKEGRHEVYVTATVGKAEEGISILQERTFKLVLNVGKLKQKTLLETIADGVNNIFNSLGDNAANAMTGMASLMSSNPSVTTLLLSLAMIAFTWKVYKRIENG